MPVTIVVSEPDVPPVFNQSPLHLGGLPAEKSFSTSLSTFVTDPADVLVFSKMGGPAWLSVSPEGELSGNPVLANLGPQSVAVSVVDGAGNRIDGQFLFEVTAPVDVAGFVTPITDAFTFHQGGRVESGDASNASSSDDSYLVLSESLWSMMAQLGYSWSLPAPRHRLATLRVEAHRPVNSDGEDFQFGVSTDGGQTFLYPSELLVTKAADDDVAQTFTFVTGDSGSVIVRVMDTYTGDFFGIQDKLYIDLIEIEFAGNSTPQVEAATFQVSSDSDPGTLVGTIKAHDSDAGQSLAFSIIRGNEAGLFAISGDGLLSIAGDISASAGTHELTVIAIDNGLPALGSHAVVTVEIVTPMIDLVVAAGETRVIDSSGSRYSSISNDGILIVSSDLVIEGDFSNRGILVISGGSPVVVNGTLSNSGVVDAINWTGEWQEEWVNNGKVLDKQSVRILSAEVNEGQFAVTVSGYNGHAFHLETSSSPGGPWQATGSSELGSGDLLDPPAVRLSAPVQESRRFFRVAITSGRKFD